MVKTWCIELIRTWSKKKRSIFKKFETKINRYKYSYPCAGPISKKLVCFGLKRIGPNILINQLVDESDCLLKRFDCLKAHALKNYQTEKIKEETISEPN